MAEAGRGWPLRVFPLADLDRMLPLCDTVLIACARQKPTTGKVSFRQGPAEAMPLPDGCADLVFMSMIYHHLNDPAQSQGNVIVSCVPVAMSAFATARGKPIFRGARARYAGRQPCSRPNTASTPPNRPVSYSLSKSPCLLAPVPALIQTFLRAP